MLCSASVKHNNVTGICYSTSGPAPSYHNDWVHKGAYLGWPPVVGEHIQVVSGRDHQTLCYKLRQCTCRGEEDKWVSCNNRFIGSAQLLEVMCICWMKRGHNTTDSVPIHGRYIEKCWEGRSWIWYVAQVTIMQLFKLVNILNVCSVPNSRQECCFNYHHINVCVPMTLKLMLCLVTLKLMLCSDRPQSFDLHHEIKCASIYSRCDS